MNSKLLRSSVVLACAAACLLAGAPSLRAAAVGPSGYTNDFLAQPAAADWATASVGGSGNDAYDMDAAAQATPIPTAALVPGAGNPVAQNASAVWSSSGFIQTRPTGNRYTVMMGKFINSTGTNATQARISYALTFAGTANPEDGGKGTRFYFSTSGAANTWTNISALNTEGTAGSLSYNATLTVNWPDGGAFYLLILDDNGGAGTDVACEFDNFFLGVTAGTPATPVDPLIITLTGPANNSTFDNTTPVTASATVTGGTTPYSVRFFLDGSPVGLAQSTAPFQANLGTLFPGDHIIRAAVTDARAWTSNSANALVHVTGPLSATIVSPTNGARFKSGNSITLSAAVGGGTGPYTVTFFTNGQARPNLTSPPFSASLGALAAGSYTTYVHVVDSALPAAAQTNSATNVFFVDFDPLANDYFTNRFTILTGQTVAGNNTGATTEPGERTTSRSATLWWKWVAPSNGTAVIDMFGSTFDTYLGVFTGSAMGSLSVVAENDDYQSVQSRVSFACQAGVEYQIQAGGFGGNQGSLMLHVDIPPVPPVVTITSPAYGASFAAGSNITVTATASSPYGAVTNVDFYEFDFGLGMPVRFAGDATAPFSVVFTNSVQGDHYVQAVLADNTGRNATSDWVYVVFTVPGVRITNPGEGQTFVTTDTIFVNVTATVLETVTNVAFYVDGSRFGQSTTSPYSAAWTAPTPGNHTLTAIAMTAAGTNYVSDPVHISVGANLVAANATWKYLDNGSNQGTNWYGTNFNDSSWASGPAPLGYGDSNGRLPATTVGFGPSSNNKYPTTYFRHTFMVTNVSQFQYMYYQLQRDDGAVVYINGQEFTRYNMNGGPVAYTDFSAANANDDGGSTFSDGGFQTWIHDGTNVIAIEIHQDAANSSDIWLAFNMIAIPSTDPSTIPPALTSILPAPGDSLFTLTNITFTFSEAVTNVDASDLLINNVPAASVTGSSNRWTFSFPQPPIGAVNITVVDTNGIVDFDSPPKLWGGSFSYSYTLLDVDAPTVAGQTPPASTTVSNLSQVSVTFNKAVTGVNASDLLVNGSPALSVSGGPVTYTFAVPPQPEGSIFVYWSVPTGIADAATGTHLFDESRPQNTWSYVLQDQAAPFIIARSPAAGALVTNLTSLTVTFSEGIAGIGASDLLVNGLPATGITTNNGTNFTFTFPRPNGTVVNVSWAPTHGITDLALSPNAFNASGPGATWAYSTPDTVPPAVVSLDPPAFVTLRTLTQIRVTFTEPVTGVDTNDLVINGRSAATVSGAGAGPYLFTFPSPTNGPVSVAWRAGHGITDLASSPNAFAGGAWTYVLDPNASYAGSVVINEIMYDPAGGRASDEWLELLNLTAAPINLAGWKFTKGVSFTFPNVNLPANGYLVVAANTASFASNYPSVANVVGGWTGTLRNNGENVQLETALGDVVAKVAYSSEGDWGLRERGNGAAAVASLTRSGNTVTATLFNHGYTASDQVIITGADQPEYNGRFTVASVPNRSTFIYTISGTPITPATGAIISHQVRDDGVSGWAWFSPANGMGASTELLNANFDPGSGQNWAPSIVVGGTPGRPNSGATNNIAPLVLNVAHFPPVPRSTDPVTITARVRDELSNGVSTVQLFYRNHSTTSPGAFISGPMFDDGAHGDGAAGDGSYGAILPAMANRTIIEFYVSAADSSGNIRTWPAPAWETNGVGGTFGTLVQGANALYQVDDGAASTAMPTLRFILTGTEAAVFPPGNRNSDGAYNGTLIAQQSGQTDIRYLCDARVRGAGTRTRTPPSNRINIPHDNLWNGRSAINVGSQFVHAQLIGNVLAEEAGLFSEAPYVVQYRINGNNPAPLSAPINGSSSGSGWGTFILARPMDGDLAAEAFPDDDAGNTYRASTGSHSADLSYQGTNPTSYLGRGYYKTSNQSENDWSDMFALTAAFSFTGANSDYIQGISTNVNVRQWMTYFALSSFLNDGETKLANGIGDDFGIYRGISDPRFVLEAHDYDTVFGEGDTGSGYYPINTNSSIFLMLNPPNPNANVPLLRRFMTNNAFVPIYYAELKRLADTVFNPTNLAPLIDQNLGTWGVGPDETVLQRMKDYAECRRQIILTQIPLDLTLTTALTTDSGYLFTTSPNVGLSGNANAIDTRSVLVNGQPANWSGFNASWNSTATLQPGINKVLVQAFDSNNVEIARATAEIWYSNAAPTSVSGTIAADTTWSGSGGPYLVTGNLTVNSGATLTIQPGTTVYLAPGVNITVNSGGRLLAQGTDAAHIRFTRQPGTSGNWGNIRFNGAVGSPESRLSYVDIQFNAISTSTPALQVSAGTVFFDHLTFANTASPYIHVDGASFVIQNSVFPTPTDSFEMVHGTGGIKAGGRGIFTRNFFGVPNNYNDVVDFTGGNHPGQPIVQFINNVFTGASDDILDLDGTDAWIEGNIFLHAHKNGSPDSASAISGGLTGSDRSELTIIGNLFYDCDQIANAKEGNFYTFYNNTMVRQNHSGGTDTTGAVALLADVGTAEGAGMYFEGNIIYDAENLVSGRTNAVVTFTNNILFNVAGPAWTGPGGNNSTVDPLLTYIPQVAETSNFTSWASAQVLRQWFALRADSPARGAGPNGADKGGVMPVGISISGEPQGITSRTTATLSVGVNRTGSGIPASSWTSGSGYVAYKWRLDAGPWSAEIPINNPIVLNNLANGPHFVEVSGKRDSLTYQDDPDNGPDARVTVSRTWRVDTSLPAIHINEILASNNGSVPVGATTPDVIELVNDTGAALDLGGMGLTDDTSKPFKFTFAAGTVVPSGGYLVAYANDPDANPGIHIGFNIPQSGGSLYLYNSIANGGALLDSVEFGAQLTDYSIGRLADGSWTLTLPTFGAKNRAAALGDPMGLRINEWLATGTAPFDNDFVEIYNGGALPVALGGLRLSDAVMSNPGRHTVAPLTFIGATGYFVFIADGNTSQGAEHLNFNLASDQGAVGLYLPDLTPIDIVVYSPQNVNRSQGRSPNGAGSIVFFDTPTPGAPNPIVSGPLPYGGALVINEVLAINANRTEVVAGVPRTPDWVEIYNGTVNLLDLSGLSLTDDTLQPRRFVFTNSTLIAPGGYFRVLCSPNIPVGPNSAGFGLAGSGGAVYLFDKPANGGSLLSAIAYGIQVEDLSIGRIPSGGTNWVLTSPTPSAPNVALPSLGDPSALRVNEWMADAGPGNDDWFEIYNPGTAPVALGGMYLTDNLSTRTKHRIANLSYIGSGTNAWLKFVADGNTAAGADHVSFSLAAGGEAVGISTTAGVLIDGVAFGAQVEGVSQGRFPDGAATIVAFPGTDSAGASNYRMLTNVIINEALTHTDEPLEDAIELYNPTAQPIDISGWWLSDDPGTLRKYQIPFPTVIPAFGFTVIFENHFTNRNEAAVPFALSSGGDEVVLSSITNNTLTGYRTSVKFGPAHNGVSFGRYVTSDNRQEFVSMSARTFGVDNPGTIDQFRASTGRTNAYPRVGPVVISQIMYHPLDNGTNDNFTDEFIELLNTSASAVPLYDPLAATNTWRFRDAVDFNFPAGVTLASGGRLVVVSFNPVSNPSLLAAFRARFNVPTEVGVYGPYSGKLANSDAKVELYEPDTPNTNGVPYVLIERVHYYDTAPWPAAADGTGYVLRRISLNGYANDPTNWVASLPSFASDSDGDGMPDWWESQYGLNPETAIDANQDADGDGLTNLQEYAAGTNPKNAADVVKLRLSMPSSSSALLTFDAKANKAYTVDYKTSLSGAWTPLIEIPASPVDRTVPITTPTSGEMRFYRLRVK